MQELGVICEIDESTEWCAGMVVVPKGNGKVRICLSMHAEKAQLPLS